MNERDELWQPPRGWEQRNLVQVLDHHVVFVEAQRSFEIASHHQRRRVPPADTVDLDSIQICSGRSALPGATQQVDLMTEPAYSPEDFSQMKFGATCLRIFVVLPVEYEYPH